VTRVQKPICTRRTRQTCSPYLFILFFFFFVSPLTRRSSRRVLIHAYIYNNIHFFLLIIYYYYSSCFSLFPLAHTSHFHGERSGRPAAAAAASSSSGGWGGRLAFVLSCCWYTIAHHDCVINRIIYASVSHHRNRYACTHWSKFPSASYRSSGSGSWYTIFILYCFGKYIRNVQ